MQIYAESQAGSEKYENFHLKGVSICINELRALSIKHFIKLSLLAGFEETKKRDRYKNVCIIVAKDKLSRSERSMKYSSAYQR